MTASVRPPGTAGGFTAIVVWWRRRRGLAVKRGKCLERARRQVGGDTPISSRPKQAGRQAGRPGAGQCAVAPCTVRMASPAWLWLAPVCVRGRRGRSCVCTVGERQDWLALAAAQNDTPLDSTSTENGAHTRSMTATPAAEEPASQPHYH